jgi:hypothetical protein
LIAARFGYLRKQFFWDYLSAPTRSAKYRAWNILMETGCLENYERPIIADDVFKLTKKGKRILRNHGVNPVSANHPLFIEHDDYAVHFLLSGLQKDYFSSEWMSEKMLKQFTIEERRLLLGPRMEKLPDLIFEIKLHGTNLKCALEIERTRKEKFRYREFVSSYGRAEKIDLVIVAHKDESIKKGILESARSWSYPQNERPIVFCKLKDMQYGVFNFQLDFGDQKISFIQYLENLGRLSAHRLTEASRTESPREFLESSDRLEGPCTENSS